MKVEYLIRSLLFLPAHVEKLMDKASKCNADVLSLDIEDSCQTPENKQIARDNIKRYIENGLFKGRIVFPRVNDRESGELLKDVYQLSIPGITGFIYPKCQNSQDVFFIGKLLETIEYEKGYPIGTFKLILLIETTGAVAHINEICEACPERVVAIAFGHGDYIADLGGIDDENDRDNIYLARATVANAAKANGLIPLDIVHVKLHDTADLEKEANDARRLGYEGKMTVHPKEIDICNKFFSPSEEQVTWAKEMIELSENAVTEGRSVAVKNSKFVAPPMLRMAKAIMEKYRKCCDHDNKRLSSC